MKLNYTLHRIWQVAVVFIVGYGRLYAQALGPIHGSIVDAGIGEGLPGVSVKILGTTTGTLSSSTGTYSFTASLNPGIYKLEYSFTGYRVLVKSVTLGTSPLNIDVRLDREALSLNELVVTGTSAGTTRKQLGSYVTTLKAAEISKGATGNVLAALQGKSLGAQISQNSGDPAGGVSVRLRGISTVSGSSEPLYIIDGIIANNRTSQVTNTDANYGAGSGVGEVGQNRLADLNPADIDHVEILNGAAASAIYGSRANSGVIQIFTKRGLKGKLQVSFSSSATTSSLRKALSVNESPTKIGGSPDVQTQSLLNLDLTNSTPVNRYDYQKYIYRTAFGTDNTVSVSGGTDDTKYYTSLSYFANQGIIKNTDFQRFSFRSNLDQKLSNWATLTTGFNFVNSNTNEKPDGNTFFSPTNSINIIGNYYDISRRDALGNLQAVGERGRVNPVSIIEDIQQKQQTNRILANATLKVFPVRNLTIDYTLGVDNASSKGTEHIPPFAYNVSPGFYGGGPTLTPTLNGYASTGDNQNLQLNSELNATYNWKITNNLTSTTQLGYSYQFQKTNLTILQGQGLAPFIQTVNGASTVLPGTDSRSQFWVSGEYLQQNFKYKGQFFVTGALRIDGSSVFGLSQRNQKYLKASGSYVLSSAEYWRAAGLDAWWDVFKLRAAYGEAGNLTGIGPYDRFNSYSVGPYDGLNAFTSRSILANVDVQPERQKELEVGTDLSFFRGRLGITANYYKKRVDHLLLNRLIAPTTGFSSAQDNFGALQNRGLELLVTGTPIKAGAFQWNATVIFNQNRNKALQIGNALTLFSSNAGAPVAIIEGQPIGVFYGRFFARDGSGNIITNTAGLPRGELGVQNSPLTYTPGRDAAGQPTGSVVRKIIGDPNPKYTGSLITEFSYKKLSLRVQLDDVHGSSVFNADYRTRQGVDNGKVAQAEDLGKLPRGYVSSIYPIEEFRIDDGSFVKLREVALTYLVGDLGSIKGLSVTLSGRNLYSWDKYKGYDPEVNAGGQSTSFRNIDFGTVPIPRTFSFGVQAKF